MCDEDIWNAFTVLKKRQNTADNKKMIKKKALREGTATTEVKNKNRNQINKNRKLDEVTEGAKHKTVGISLGKEILAARQKLNLSQKDLANKVNQKPAIIQEYESGKAIPNHQLLNKIKRVLKM